jgi:MFS family permease
MSAIRANPQTDFKNGGETKKKAKPLSRETIIVSITSFLTDVSSEMMVPLMPFFLTTVLGASVFVVGLVEGWAAVALSLMDMFSGWLSDKTKRRKPLMIAGYGLSSLMKPLFAFAASWQQVLAFRFIERMGKGLRRVPRDAMIGDLEGKENLGKAFGLRKMMDSLGATLGPLLATLLIVYLGGMPTGDMYREIFLIASIPAFIGVALLFFLREKPRDTEKISQKANIATKNFSAFILVAAFFSIAQMGISFFLLKSGELLPLAMIPVAYLAYNAIYTSFAMPAGMLTDKIGPRRMLSLAYILFAITCLLFGIYSNFYLTFILFALLGIVMAIIETTPRVYLVQTTPGHKYGTAIGTYQGITGLLLLPANLMAGALWGLYIDGMHVPFMISAAIAAIAAVILFFAVKEPAKYGNSNSK